MDTCVEEEGNTKGKIDWTEKQIVSFSIDFLLAGYGTTADALSFTSYLLALNPEVQERLQAEIDKYFEENPVNTYNIIIMSCLCTSSQFFFLE